jgi:O-methyltransferase
MIDSIDRILTDYSLIPNNMVRVEHVRIVMENLDRVIADEVAGDIVEFGCFEGTTSLFIARLLRMRGSDRGFHVYDSFQGLPAKGVYDGSSANFFRGCCQTSRLAFEMNFTDSSLPLPEIHEGWFRDLGDEDLPGSISFAFLDGDFYTSIVDSLRKVYPRMTPNGRIVIHDYMNPELPGVEKACEDFFGKRNERVENVGCGLIVKSR